MDVRTSLARWWSPKSGAERRIWIAAGAGIALALLWFAAWQPLTRDIVATRATVAGADAALAAARPVADEIAGLARAAAPPASADPRADLERILGERSLRAALTQQEWKDGRVRLTFAAVPFDTLVAALESLQRDARLRTVEATLTARVEPGTVRAELVLAR